MKINTLLVLLNIAGIICAGIWLLKDRTMEPLITTIGLIGSLLALIYSKNENESKINMKQRGGKNSKNYQSARDININTNDK